MKTILLVSALMFALHLNPVSAQTASDIKKAYGKPVEVYSVSEHIWMTPEYDPDGQVCEMRLYSKQIDENTSYVSTRVELNFNELEAFLNRLVPPDTRGLKDESFGQTATGGPATWTTFEYATVRFTFIAPFGPIPFDGETLRKGEFVFSEKYVHMEKPSRLPANNDFSSHSTSHTQIVTIRWKQRECLRD